MAGCAAIVLTTVAAQAATMTYAGPWSAATSYAAGAVVSHANQTYTYYIYSRSIAGAPANGDNCNGTISVDFVNTLSVSRAP